MKFNFKANPTSVVLRVKLMNSSVSTGAGLTGIAYNTSGLIISTMKIGEATATAYTAAGGNIEDITTLGTYAAPTSGKCRFKEVDSTNHKGVYEIQIADARFASTTQLIISISGATNLAEFDCEVSMLPVDANLIQIDGYATNDNLATLKLKQLDITNSAGTAVIVKATGSNGNGLDIKGHGVGSGIHVASPSSFGVFVSGGYGVYIDGTTYDGLTTIGAVNGFQAQAYGDDGNGILAIGTGTEAGIKAWGTESAGMEALGVGDGSGIKVTGGTVGIEVIAGANGEAIKATGSGSGAGIKAVGGSAGHGVDISTSASDAIGVKINSENGTGLQITGEIGAHLYGSDTNALRMTSDGLSGSVVDIEALASSGISDAVRITGSSTVSGANGIKITGGSDGAAVSCTGSGSGAGIKIQGGSTGMGVDIDAGTSSTDPGVSINANNGTGMRISGEIGVDIYASDTHGLQITADGSSGAAVNIEALTGSGVTDGVNIKGNPSQSDSCGIRVTAGLNSPALKCLGNGTGSGIKVVGGATGNGIETEGTGSGAGIKAQGGLGAGDGILAIGGDNGSATAAGMGIHAKNLTAGSGVAEPQGSGICAESSAQTGHAMYLEGTGSSSCGINTRSQYGSGLLAHGWLKDLDAKEIGIPTDLGSGASLSANNVDLAGTTFSPSTDSQEAIRDAISSSSSEMTANIKDTLLNKTVITRHANQKPSQYTAGTGGNIETVDTTIDVNGNVETEIQQ